MRTLALLAALLLLALQAQAEPLPENNEEAPDQEQPGEEDQDMAISFAGPEAPGLQRSGPSLGHPGVCPQCPIHVSVSVSPGLPRNPPCSCRRGGCSLSERFSGSCFQDGKRYPLCCRRGW
uniref:Mammalian defensins domain-containing protein n=1 Tax=Marmota marmota marmota TaxID=9994 RepID=A0A8C6ADG9_MARMA